MFQGNDRVFALVSQPEKTGAATEPGSRLRPSIIATSPEADDKLRELEVEVGTSLIPKGSRVLVRPAALVSRPVRWGDKFVHILQLSQVEAWSVPSPSVESPA